MRSLIKKFTGSVALTLAAFFSTGVSSAAVMQIGVTGLNYHYVPDTITPSNSRICDSLSCAGGNGAPANADPLASMTFTVNSNFLSNLSPPNIRGDFRFNLAGLLQAPTTPQAITSGYLHLLTTAGTPGWGLALEITGGSAFISAGTLIGSATAILCGACDPNNNLPIPGTFMPPFTISFSANIDNVPVPTANGFETAFTADGSANVRGIFVPEPGPLALIGIGLLSLLGFRMARARAA